MLVNHIKVLYYKFNLLYQNSIDTNSPDAYLKTKCLFSSNKKGYDNILGFSTTYFQIV